MLTIKTLKKKTGQIAQSIMCLPIPRKHILKASAGQVKQACNPSAKEAETDQSLELASQPTWKVPSQWETLSQNKNSEWWLRTTLQTPKLVFWPPHTYAHVHMCLRRNKNTHHTHTLSLSLPPQLIHTGCGGGWWCPSIIPAFLSTREVNGEDFKSRAGWATKTLSEK